MNTLAERLQAIHARITQAKSRIGRNDTVQLCAVSKAQDATKIRLAYAAGQRIFGENYVQEAIEKQALLQDCAIEWHFIGPIQSNKTGLIAEHFDWVHSVDRLKIAQRLSQSRSPDRPPLNICLQLNSSGEDSKSGVAKEALLPLAHAVKALPNISLRGIMAIPAPVAGDAAQCAQFQVVNQAYIALQQAGFPLDTLSIGMSDDFEAAITEGATIVRIGAALFGPRIATPVHNLK